MKIEIKYSVEKINLEEFWYLSQTSRPLYKRRYYLNQNGKACGEFFIDNKLNAIGTIEYSNGGKIVRRVSSWKQLRSLRKIKILKEELNKLMKETYVRNPN